MPYCPNCGSQIQSNSKFCSNCGNQLQNSMTPPRPQGEQIVTVMSGLEKGMLRRDKYLMLITPMRLMFVKLTGDDIRELGQSMVDEAKAQGAGRLRRWATAVGANQNMGDMLIGWTPQQVEAKYNEVFSVSNASVNELRIRKKTEEYNDWYELRVKSPGYNEKFRLENYQKHHNEALKQLLGNRFKSNTWFL